jgi:membrane fusion protein (multidrug efflux system)
LAGLKITATATILMVAAVVGFYFVQQVAAQKSGGKPGPGGPGGVPMGPVEVSVVTVKPQRLTLTTELPGRTSPYLVAEVRPQVNGLVQTRLFNEGADVKAGDVLYQIDPAPSQAAVDNAAATLAGARKASDRARAALKAGLANVEQQRATLELSQLNRRRIESLSKDGAVSVSDRDKAVTDAKLAEATLTSAQAQVQSNQEALAEAETAIKQAEAALKTAKINLDYTRIIAPITGRIGKSNVTVGALAKAYQDQSFTTIQQLDPIYVDVPRSTVELLRLKRSLDSGRLAQNKMLEKKVKLILDDGTEYAQEGTLQFRDVTVDQSTGAVLLRVIVPNPDGLLLPGMFVRAVLKEGVSEQAILVPQQSVSRDPKGNPLALVVSGEAKVEQRKLTVDRAIGDQWLVTSGLKAGDRVIVEGALKVRPGDSVKVAALAPEPKETPKPVQSAAVVAAQTK